MVEKSINSGIMESIQKYIEKISKYYKIEPHPITTEDYEKVSNPFVKEVMNTGIKVA